MSKKSGLGKFLAGIGIGAGIGLLFAPKKGEELRKDLKEACDKLINKVKEIGFAREYVTYFSKRKTSDTSAETTRQAANIDRYILSYYNSSGTQTRYAGYYGLYLAFTAPTVASATAASTYVRCTSPSLSYRASTTYSSAANLQSVTDCQFIWTVKVYTADPGSTVGKRIERDLDTLLTNT